MQHITDDDPSLTCIEPIVVVLTSRVNNSLVGVIDGTPCDKQYKLSPIFAVHHSRSSLLHLRRISVTTVSNWSANIGSVFRRSEVSQAVRVGLGSELLPVDVLRVAETVALHLSSAPRTGIREPRDEGATWRGHGPTRHAPVAWRSIKVEWISNICVSAVCIPHILKKFNMYPFQISWCYEMKWSIYSWVIKPKWIGQHWKKRNFDIWNFLRLWGIQITVRVTY